MCSSDLGKTCENQRKRTDIHLVNDRVKAAKLVDKPHCLDARLFNEKLVGIEMQKVKMLLTKPSYVGFVVLELSKFHIIKYAIPTYPHMTPNTLSYFLGIIHHHQSNEIIAVLIRFDYDIIKAR